MSHIYLTLEFPNSSGVCTKARKYSAVVSFAEFIITDFNNPRMLRLFASFTHANLTISEVALNCLRSDFCLEQPHLDMFQSILSLLGAFFLV